MPLTLPLAELLDRALRAQHIPIVGVSLGSETDRATWTAQYRPEATAEQRAAGDTLLATIDPQEAATVTAIKGELAGTRLNDDVLKAVIQALHEAIPTPKVTVAQLRQRILELVRAS